MCLPGGQTVLSGLDGNEMIGLAMGHIRHWYEGTEYMIDELCVRTDRQGQGVGTAFLRDMEDYLRRLLERETRALEGMERGTAAQDQLEAQRAVVRRIRAALEGSTCQL